MASQIIASGAASANTISLSGDILTASGSHTLSLDDGSIVISGISISEQVASSQLRLRTALFGHEATATGVAVGIRFPPFTSLGVYFLAYRLHFTGNPSASTSYFASPPAFIPITFTDTALGIDHPIAGTIRVISSDAPGDSRFRSGISNTLPPQIKLPPWPC